MKSAVGQSANLQLSTRSVERPRACRAVAGPCGGAAYEQRNDNLEQQQTGTHKKWFAAVLQILPGTFLVLHGYTQIETVIFDTPECIISELNLLCNALTPPTLLQGEEELFIWNAASFTKEQVRCLSTVLPLRHKKRTKARFSDFCCSTREIKPASFMREQNKCTESIALPCACWVERGMSVSRIKRDMGPPIGRMRKSENIKILIES